MTAVAAVRVVALMVVAAEIICSSKKYIELKWIAGMFYWMER